MSKTNTIKNLFFNKEVEKQYRKAHQSKSLRLEVLEVRTLMSVRPSAPMADAIAEEEEAPQAMVTTQETGDLAVLTTESLLDSSSTPVEVQNTNTEVETLLPVSGEKPKLATPTVKVTDCNRKSITISWSTSDASKVEHYNVIIATSEKDLESATPENVGNTTSKTFSNLTPGTQYYIQVRAIPKNTNKFGYSEKATICATTESWKRMNTPNIRQDLTTSTTNSITVKWDKLKHATRYTLYWSTDNTNWQQDNQIKQPDTDIVSYTLNNLNPETTYYFRVRGDNDNLSETNPYMESDSTASYAVSTKTKTDLGILSIKEVTCKQKSITVSWNMTEVKGEIDHYNVKIATSEADLEKIDPTTVENATSITFKNLTPNTQYYFQVRAVPKDKTQFKYSNTVSDSVSTEAWKRLDIPQIDDKKTVVTKNSITVQWAKVPHASRYTIFWSTDNTNWQQDNQIKQPDTDIVSYTLNNLNPETTYYIRLRADNDNLSEDNPYAESDSTESYEVSTKTKTDLGILSIKEVICKQKSITVSWSMTEVKGEIDHYNVKIATSEADLEKIDPTTVENATSITFKNLTPNTQYYFQVRAVPKDKTQFKYSNTASDSVSTEAWKRLDIPQIDDKKTVVTKNSITVQWAKVPYASRYTIFWSTDATNWQQDNQIKQPNTDIVSYTLNNLNPSTTYYIRLRADNDNLSEDNPYTESPSSTRYEVSTTSNVVELKDLECTPIKSTDVQLTWNNSNCEKIKSIVVSKRVNGGNWETVTTGDVNLHSATATGLSAGNWEFRVQLLNSKGDELASQTTRTTVTMRYSEQEVAQLKNFFAQSANNISNQQSLGINLNSPETWTGITWEMGTDDCLHVSKINWNQKTLIGSLDCSNMTYLKNVSMTDLEYQDNSQENCCGEGLVALNFSGCTNLKKIDVSNTWLTSLNVNGCANLVTLNIVGSELEQVNLSSCRQLTNLNFEDGYFETIDLSQNTNLVNIDLNFNYLRELDLSNNHNVKVLNVSQNYLETLNVSSLKNLETLYCEENELDCLDLLANESLTSLCCADSCLSYVWFSVKCLNKLNYLFESEESGDTDKQWNFTSQSGVSNVYKSSDSFIIKNKNFTLETSDESCKVAFSIKKNTDYYDSTTISTMLAYFAEEDENGVSNQEKIADGNFDINDPATWTGCTWSETTDEEGTHQLVKLSLASKELAGDLDIDAFKELQYTNYSNSNSDRTVYTDCGDESEAGDDSRSYNNDNPGSNLTIRSTPTTSTNLKSAEIKGVLTTTHSDWDSETIPDSAIHVDAWHGTVNLEIWSEFLSGNELAISWDSSLATLDENSIQFADGVDLSGEIVTENGVSTLTLTLDPNSSYTASLGSSLLGTLTFQLTSKVQAGAQRSISFTLNSHDSSTRSSSAKTSELNADVWGIVYDMNNDTQIGIEDLVQFAKEFQTSNKAADFNSDGMVGIEDLVLFAKNFGASLAAESNVTFDKNYTPWFADNSEVKQDVVGEALCQLYSEQTYSTTDSMALMSVGQANQTWEVTNLNSQDANTTGTLPWALANAENGDTIHLCAGTYKCSIVEGINISKGITLIGENTIIDGDNKCRCLKIENISGDVTIKGITFRNGYTEQNGGAIYCNINQLQNVTIKNCQFESNSAKERGGAIDVIQTNLILDHVYMTGNKATNGGGISEWHLETTVTMNYCTLTKNYASNYGGGIYFHGSTDRDNTNGALVIKNSIVDGNTCDFLPEDHNATNEYVMCAEIFATKYYVPYVTIENSIASFWFDKNSFTTQSAVLLNENGQPLPGSAAIQKDGTVIGCFDKATKGAAIQATADGKKITVKTGGTNYILRVNNGKKIVEKSKTYTFNGKQGKTYTIMGTHDSKTVTQEITVLNKLTTKVTKKYDTDKTVIKLGKMNLSKTNCLRINIAGQEFDFWFDPTEAGKEYMTPITQEISVNGKTYLLTLEIGTNKKVTFSIPNTVVKNLSINKITFQQALMDGSSIISQSLKKTCAIK